ncbi:MAG: hypothetical protein CMB66_00500 [Euryarchaeota archaeon]|nr:hypothetical protein [Euryarchaeota archaeon]|tara:strand:+ start:84 stop:509 length:426 start_codon:yes stop_codon:yes gene_type:complete
MSGQDLEQDRRMLLIAGLAIVILALSFRALMIMESSLEQGSGMEEGVQTATIPLMALIVVLLLLMVSQINRTPIILSVDNLRIVALMTAMFLVGMLIEPLLPRQSDLPGGDAIGILILIIPIVLIVLMLLPDSPDTKEEEE